MDIEVLNQVASKSAQISSSTGGGGSNSSSGSDFADCNSATPATRNRSISIPELVWHRSDSCSGLLGCHSIATASNFEVVWVRMSKV